MKKVGLLCGREYSFPPAFIVKVKKLGARDGVTAEFVKLGGTRMGEPARYSVIVDRISHEVEYYRGYLKHAVLQGTYVINNPFWWTADDKYFNYSVASKLGIAIPKTILLPQKGYPSEVDINSESLHNLEYPVDWDGLLDYVGRPAILKPFSGGGWKHVYKVNNKEELLAAYDKTSPYCMTLQEFIDFTQYVRCFTFGKMDILPVHYDPKERKYLVDHNYLTAELGTRVVKDAQTINQALGYEMNTIEFAVKDGVPYAIDFLNPAPDFERDWITEFYFEIVVEKMARLVVDRAVSGEDSTCAGNRHAPSWIIWHDNKMTSAATPSATPPTPQEEWSEILKATLLRVPALPQDLFKRMRKAKLTFGDRVHCPFLRPFFLSPEDEERVRTVAETIAEIGERIVAAALDDKHLFAQLHLRPEEERLARIHTGYGPASTASRLDAFLLPDSLKFAE